MSLTSPWTWVATALVVAVGILLLLSVNRTERRRQSAMEGVTVGSSAAEVTDRLGVAPRSCPAGPLDHLRESFPEGWPPASIDVALEQLQERTAERWVYRLGAEAVECGGETARTEVGVDRDGRVVWVVAVLGRSVLEIPANITPAGVDSLGAEPGS